jgi:ribonuclease P/MRP protein subunit RPP1
LGYAGVSINQILRNSQLTTSSPAIPKKKKTKPDLVSIESLRLCDKVAAVINRVKKLTALSPNKQFLISRRITFETHKDLPANFLAEARDNFDVVAMMPLTESVFKQCCSTWNIDIISLDLSERLSFSLKKESVLEAVNRGIYFEIQYSFLFKGKSNLTGRI